MEITQFTYFQQVGGIDLDPVSVELTYGLERIAMYLQGVDSVYDLVWVAGRHATATCYRENEREFSTYNFEEADVDDAACASSTSYEARVPARCLERGLPLPAYDYVLKCSHAFNLLDARGAISVTERVGYIARVRDLARAVRRRRTSRSGRPPRRPRR